MQRKLGYSKALQISSFENLTAGKTFFSDKTPFLVLIQALLWLQRPKYLRDKIYNIVLLFSQMLFDLMQA